MSFNLLVFDPAIVRYQDAAEFAAWYENFTNWSDGRDYNSAAGTTVPLQIWFHDIRKTYPAMNGPFAAPHETWSLSTESKITDYSLGNEAIYVAFSWSEASGAFETVIRLAAKHELGFYNVSGEGDVWVPDGNGNLKRVF